MLDDDAPASLELVAKRELHGTPLIDRCVLAEQR